MRPLTAEERETQEWWTAVSNTLALQHGPLEMPPRILSFDELKKLELNRTYVWLEDLVTNEVKGCELGTSNISIRDRNIVSIFAAGYYSLLRKNYGKKYQCWTAYPKKGPGKILLVKNEGEQSNG